MPARLDLAGRRLGRLTVVAPDPATADRGSSRGWLVRCDCGRQEIYPQQRLMHRCGRREPVRACSACDAPSCVVCGARLTGRTPTRVCGEQCRAMRDREVWRDLYHRKAADADWRREKAQQSARRHAERMLADPAYAARQAELRRLRVIREASDPDLMERRRLRARLAYAASRDAVQAARRHRLDSLDAEQMGRWMDRVRAYGRAYQRRRRADLAENPDAHARYLDIMAEYRRRRALLRLLADAPRLTERLPDAE